MLVEAFGHQHLQLLSDDGILRLRRVLRYFAKHVLDLFGFVENLLFGVDELVYDVQSLDVVLLLVLLGQVDQNLIDPAVKAVDPRKTLVLLLEKTDNLVVLVRDVLHQQQLHHFTAHQLVRHVRQRQHVLQLSQVVLPHHDVALNRTHLAISQVVLTLYSYSLPLLSACAAATALG
mgnify:CR=1 FL=1